MQINHSDLDSFSIKSLLKNEDNDLYVIPVYQRNYEWRKEQIEQLLTDIKDYYLEEKNKNYYIGTLIVDKQKNKNNSYETIDGQQRLTTINIICCALKEMGFNVKDYFIKPIISFESRKNADETIEYIFNNGCKNEPKFIKYNVGIFDGMIASVDLLKKLKNELNEDFEDYIKYFFEKVNILRVKVPEDTDMNHYFEIMNSRGEQLEKHEILKARLMKELNIAENSLFLRKQFNYIWEACADMQTNIQLHFPKEFRKNLFGKNWFDFVIKDSEELFQTQFFQGNSENKKDKTGIGFSEIIESENIDALLSQIYDQQTVNESEGEQFQPIINFENFLLHVLKIQEQSDEVSLDDKRLLSFFDFETILKQKTNRVQFIKDFAYSLLKTRFLLDQYVIRRKYVGTGDSWSLQCVKFYDRNDSRDKDSYSFVNTFSDELNEKITMLLAMNHVSTPTLIYKYWLFAVLNFLYKNMKDEINENFEKSKQIKYHEYEQFLEQTSRNFMIYRHLSSENKEEYNTIIFRPETLNKLSLFDFEEKLTYGNIENNLVFNYLDYLLWTEYPNEFKDFEFSFRSSVEHYYPQHPITGELLNHNLKKQHNIEVNETRKNKLDLLNCFGNLCLISHRNNSRLSNHMPKAKKDYFVQAKTKDSIKQLIMMKEENWTSDEIFEHHNKMIDLLNQNLF
jgi:hypothetical protein